MSSGKYHYLFPYEKVPSASKILIYGAGDLGQDYLLQMQLTHYCEVVAMADKNFAKYPPMVVPVIDSETIREWTFDYVVVALRVAVAVNAVLGVLKEQGVERHRVICIFERTNMPTIFTVDRKEETDTLSCDENDVSMALLITGGLGDHVIQKRFLYEIMRLAPDFPIDIYALRHVDFMKYLYSDCESVRYVIEDIGTCYNTNRGRYTYSMLIEACHYLRVDEFKEGVEL